jgi:hypothetical protein
VVSSGVSPAILGIFPLELGILPHPQLPISTPPTPGRVKLFVGGIAILRVFFDLNPPRFFETTGALKRV